MSKQTSLVTFTGKMGGISFYKKDGVHVARKAGGPSRSRILTDPRFERTRENLSEFAGLAQASSSLVRVFNGVKNLRDNAVRGRAAKILRAMMKVDAGVRGQRNIQVTQHRSELLGLELNIDSPLKSALSAKFTVTHSVDRKTATLNIPELRTNAMVTAPVGSTHFQLVLLTGVLADVLYNVESNRYEPSDAALNQLSTITFSDYFGVSSADPTVVSLQAVLPSDLNDKVSVVAAVGILFFTKNGIAYYPTQQGKGMQIVDVF